MAIPGAQAPGIFLFLQNKSKILLDKITQLTWENSFVSKLDTHVDTHTNEKIRKNAAKHIHKVPRKKAIKMLVKRLNKPLGEQ